MSLSSQQNIRLRASKRISTGEAGAKFVAYPTVVASLTRAVLPRAFALLSPAACRGRTVHMLEPQEGFSGEPPRVRWDAADRLL